MNNNETKIQMLVMIDGNYAPMDFTIDIVLKPGDNLVEIISDAIRNKYENVLDDNDCDLDGHDLDNWDDEKPIIPYATEILTIS